MSYKRVVEKKGKSYGPYIYESYRDENGKVKKRYLGKLEEKKNQLSLFLTVGFLALVLIIGGGYTTDLFLNEGRVSENIVGSVEGFSSGVVSGITGLVVDDDSSEDSGSSSDSEPADDPEPEEEASEPEAEVKSEEEIVVEETAEEVVEEIIEEEIVEETENETTVEETVDEEAVEDVNETIVEENETIVNEDPEEDVSAGGGAGVSNETILNETIVNETIVNETIVENVTEEVNETIVNETVVNETVLNETLVNETIVLNETIINETIIENVTDVSTLQYKAVINRPVKWIKTVNVSGDNVSVKLPKDAENISVLTGQEVSEAIGDIDEFEDVVNEADREDMSEGGLITGNVALDIREGDGLLIRLWNWLASFTVTGNVILEDELEEEITETENATFVEISDIVSNETEVAVEYYTEAPQANETILENGKRVVVHAPDELNYTEILAYTLVDDLNISMNDSRLKLYWYASEEDAIALGYLNAIEEVEEVIKEVIEEETVEETSNETVAENVTEELNATVEINETVEEVPNETEEPIEEEVVEENETEISAGFLTGNVILSEETEEVIEIVNSTLDEEVVLALNASVAPAGIKIEVGYVPYDFDEDGIADYIEWIVPHLSVQVYQIIVTDVSDEDVFYFDDVVAETQFTHLNMSDVAPYDSLILYLPFDTNTSTSGDVFDYSREKQQTVFPYAFDEDSGLTTDGAYGGGFMFDGDDDYLFYNTFSVTSDNITTSFWMKKFGYTGLNETIVMGDGLLVSLDGDTNKIAIFNGTSFMLSDISPPQNEWVYVATVTNSTGTDFYYNGVYNSTTPVVTGSGIFGSPLTILGAGANANTEEYNGSLDEFMIFESSLTATQISDIYNNQSVRFKPSGTQTLNFRSVVAGNNQYNISASLQNEMGSNLSARVGYWTAGDGYNETDLSNGLVSYYHFDEDVWTGAADEVIDAMGLNNGTSAGNANTTSDSEMFGNVGVFDGAGDTISPPSTSDFNFGVDDFTISTWFKSVGIIPTVPVFVGKGDTDVNEWMFRLTSTNVDFYANVSEYYIHQPAPGVLGDGLWHHAVVTRAENTTSVYLDAGTPISQTGNILNLTNSKAFTIGGADGNSVRYWNGSLDDFMIFNRSLSTDEVKELFIKGRADWTYTDYQNLTSGEVSSFEFGFDSTHILPEFEFLAGTDDFYTPILQSEDTSGAQQNLTINMTDFFTSVSYDSTTDADLVSKDDNVFVNVSATDVGYGDGNVSTFIDFDNSLVSWYRMDDVNATHVLDYTGRNDGTIVNAVVGDGYMGDAMSFDGVGDYVDVPYGASIDPSTNPHSFSMWVKSDNITNNVMYFSAGTGTDQRLYLAQYGGSWDMGIHSTDWSSGTTAVASDWTHLAVVMNGTDALLYVNGEYDFKQSYTSYSTSLDFNIGRHASGGYYWNGSIDDVMIFNRSLSADEIVGLYTNTTSKYLDVNYANLSPGEYTVKPYSQDTAGNVNDSLETRTITVGVIPLIAYNSNSDNDSVTNNEVFVNVTASDASTGNGNISTFVNFDNSLISWWRMDDTNATHVLDYMDRNNGTIAGNPVVSDGYMGNGMNFDGVGDYVNFGDVDSMDFGNQENFTISTWFRYYEKYINTIFQKFSSSFNNGTALYVNTLFTSDQKLVFSHIGSVDTITLASDAGLVSDSNWHHAVVRKDGFSYSLYYDNVLVANNESANIGTYVSTSDLALGITYDLSSFPFNGSIDDVMIFNRSLSNDEIGALYANSSSRTLAVSYAGTNGENYTFNAYTQDTDGYVASTTERTVTVDNVAPDINFVSPTPYDSSSQAETNVEINVSINETNLAEVIFDWNGTNQSLYDDYLIFMLNFDEYTGYNDTSVWESDISCGAGACPTFNPSGKFGGAYDFSGVDDHFNLSVLTYFDLNGANYTISLWVKADTLGRDNGAFTPWTGGDSYLFNIGAQYMCGPDYLHGPSLRVDDSGNVLYSHNSAESTITSGSQLSLDEYHLLTVVYNSSHINLYIDGKLDATMVSVGADYPAIEYYLGIGAQYTWCYGHSYLGFWDGSIDEVRVWGKSFSNDEIKQQYMMNLNKYDSDGWMLYVNQVKNSTDGLAPGSYDYEVSATDAYGNLNSTGERTVIISLVATPLGYRFMVQDAMGDNVASFDDKGDAYFAGTVSENQGSLVAPGNSFVVQNSSGDTIAYVDSSGDIYMLGVISIDDGLSVLTSGNLEFRNATDSLVSFFDNLGNLKLGGGYLTGYASP